MKRIYPCIIAIILIVFSFYYTNLAVNIVRDNNPIMKKIIMVSKEYKTNSSNAILINNNIVPGISGEEIDLNGSYEAMKKYGDYNEDLLVFKNIEPSISINNIYDKYIVKGNNNNSNVSLLFILKNDNNLERILDILNKKEVRVNFFLNEELFNSSILNMINNSNHSINLIDNYNNSIINKNNKILKNKINKKLKYCYFEKEDNNKLKICSNNKLYSIIPSILTDNSPYIEIKSIENGSIIELNNSNQTVKELNSIINYIKQKGFNIVSLDDLIKE